MTAIPPPAEGEIRQVLVHPAVWTSLELWLLSHGIELNHINPGADDDLPTYAMNPVVLHREGHDPSPTEAGRQDRAYWADRYAEGPS